MLKVLCISELAERIFGLLNDMELARLAHLSRLLFEYVIPAAWEDMDPKRLMMLIPGVQMIQDEVNSAYSYILNVPNDPDLSRFNIYAPHVKYLRGTPECTVEFSAGNHSTFGSGLLPNLQYITLTSKMHYDGGDLGTIFVPINIDWVYHFLCPSLVGFEMFAVEVDRWLGDESDEYLPWMDRAACLHLVSEMSNRCPSMETLRVFPDDSGPDDFFHAYAKLATMANLCSFTCSGHRVNQGLIEALGALPCLESLCFLSNIAEAPDYYSEIEEWVVEHNPEWDAASDPIIVSEESFTELRSLKLYNLGPQTIAKLCRLGPLIRHLERLEVSYELSYASPHWRRHDQTWWEDVFACLGRGCPGLTDLVIGSVPRPLELTAVVERLGRMPLRYLNLSWIWASDNFVCKQFAEALPRLEELNIGAGSGYEWLRVFATSLPNLLFLSVGTLNFAEMDERKELISWEGQTPEQYRQTITIRTTFRLKYPMERQVDEVARYIYDTWPNARCEAYARADSVDQKAARLLNAGLEVLRLGQN
ncbi:hypothetical protein FRC07_013742 [Ceratobasidium sp. 392]|nr:hypothetical protein FRC07_013742 [Ceratobasidium sp. 392]